MAFRPILAAAAAAMLLPGAAAAADLFVDDTATLLRSETFTAELFAGYLMTSAREYVYNVPGDGSKLSQLNWSGNAFALGGRIAFRPFDGVTVRAKGWSTVASENEMTDYDWLGGYYGDSSWSHRSISPDTRSAKAWQADISAAVGLYEEDGLSVTGIAGYRHFTTKWNARGGSYIYSEKAFRDTVGSLPADRIAIAYQQWWKTPYAGLGIAYSDADWSFAGELVGSPLVMAEDKDHHALRQLLYRDSFGLSGMVGVSGSVEYRFSPVLSVAGRVEYQNYLGAKGATKIFDPVSGAARNFPSPAAGASAETLLVSLGVKVRL